MGFVKDPIHPLGRGRGRVFESGRCVFFLFFSLALDLGAETVYIQAIVYTVLGSKARMKAQEISEVRKSVRALIREMVRLVEVFLAREPFLKGCVYVSRRRCGTPGCACNRGELHASKVLAYRGRGKQQNLSPSEEEVRVLGKMTSSYRRFRSCRARFVKASRELLERIDLLEAERLEAGEKRFRGTATGKRAR
jgi:hypothetical protein